MPRKAAPGNARSSVAIRPIDRRLLATVDDHHSARCCQTLGDGKADAAGGTGDDGGLARKIDLHGQTSRSAGDVAQRACWTAAKASVAGGPMVVPPVGIEPT
jgi:hypothetical protein